MTVYLTIFEWIWLEYEMSHFMTFDFNDTDWQHKNTQKNMYTQKYILDVFCLLIVFVKCVEINSN